LNCRGPLASGTPRHETQQPTHRYATVHGTTHVGTSEERTLCTNSYSVHGVCRRYIAELNGKLTLTTGPLVYVSASHHVRDVIGRSIQTLYALRVLHLMEQQDDDALQIDVFRSVIVCKLLCVLCVLRFCLHTHGSESTRSCSVVNGAAFVRRI